MSHPSIALLEVYLVLGHYHTTVKLGDSGERMWALSHKMIELAMTLGLHRDPDERGLPEHEVAKRRWVWWNILSFERYVFENPFVLHSKYACFLGGHVSY